MQHFAQRKWPRLKNYVYSSEGFYFITICTKNRKRFLSRIEAHPGETARLLLSEYGCVVESYLVSFPGIEKYVIMPNHIHLIVHKTNGKSICDDVRSFKGLVTKKIGKSIWQDSFYDHVIRDEADYLIKWNYIEENPEKWAEDEYYL